jgi:hypothetical protein
MVSFDQMAQLKSFCEQYMLFNGYITVNAILTRFCKIDSHTSPNSAPDYYQLSRQVRTHINNFVKRKLLVVYRRDVWRNPQQCYN